MEKENDNSVLKGTFKLSFMAHSCFFNEDSNRMKNTTQNVKRDAQKIGHPKEIR
jgi:hypothetical protein